MPKKSKPTPTAKPKANLPAKTNLPPAVVTKLATAVARDLYSVEEIKKSLSLTDADYRAITATNAFKEQLTAAVSEWNDPDTTTERVRIKAAIMVEHFLPEIHRKLHDANEPLSSKVALAQTAMKLAQLPPTDGGAGTEKISISIRIGEESKAITVEATPRRQDTDE